MPNRIAAPILTSLGLPLLTAHMFVFYYGLVGHLTPPVCVAAFVAYNPVSLFHIHGHGSCVRKMSTHARPRVG
ncbi:MAG: TRAP transporter large permease subunit [Candidatus Hodarchaeota archaeon]